MPLLRPVNFCQLLRHIGAQQQVAAGERMLFGFSQIFRSLSKLAALAGNDPNMPKDFSAPGRRIVAVNGEQLLALRESLVEAAGGGIKPNFFVGKIERGRASAF